MALPYGVEKHSTSMTHEQRGELVRILFEAHGYSRIAPLTDSEIFEQWLFECDYDGGVNHIESRAD
jgi:hypothetical protein